MQRGIFSRLTFHPALLYSAAWSPDGSRLAVAAFATKGQIMPAKGSGTPVTVSEEPLAAVRDWSPDGRTILVQQQNSSTGMDVLSLPVSDKPQSLTPVLNSQFDEVAPRLSPDGHWLSSLRAILALNPHLTSNRKLPGLDIAECFIKFFRDPGNLLTGDP